MKGAITGLLSGSMATFARLAVVFAIQLALVPLYLRGWGVSEYGSWIAIQTLSLCFAVPDVAVQNYLEANYLRRSKGSKRKLSHLVAKGISTGIVVSAIQALLAVAFVLAGGVALFVSDSAGAEDIGESPALAFVICSLSYWAASGASGVLGRASLSFGSIAPQVWCSILTTMLGAAAPAIVAWSDGTVVQAAMAYFFATAISGAVATAYFSHFFRLRGIKLYVSKRCVDYSLLVKSGGLIVKGYAELAKAQGFRIVAIAAIGAHQMAAVSVLKTLVGVLQQLYSVLVAPIYPRFLQSAALRDKNIDAARLIRIEMAACVLVLMPLGLALDVLAPALMQFWTHGKIVYHRETYFLLLAATLTVALMFPIGQLMQAHSMVREQGVIAVAGVTSMVGGILAFSSTHGRAGVALGILCSELISAVVAVYLFCRSPEVRHYQAVIMRPVLTLAVSMTVVLIAAYVNLSSKPVMFAWIAGCGALVSVRELWLIKVGDR